MIGPDPLDVGGIAELKWIAELADLHGILVAPHGIADGLIGLAAHVHLAATLPRNYIALEYPVGRPDWWYDLIEGLPDPIVEDGFINGSGTHPGWASNSTWRPQRNACPMRTRTSSTSELFIEGSRRLANPGDVDVHRHPYH